MRPSFGTAFRRMFFPPNRRTTNGTAIGNGVPFADLSFFSPAPIATRKPFTARAAEGKSCGTDRGTWRLCRKRHFGNTSPGRNIGSPRRSTRGDPFQATITRSVTFANIGSCSKATGIMRQHVPVAVAERKSAGRKRQSLEEKNLRKESVRPQVFSYPLTQSANPRSFGPFSMIESR